jgi:hypothetical protein
MRKNLLFFVCLFCFSFSKAEKGEFYLYGNLGYNLAYKDKSIAVFQNDYNTLWSANLKEGFHKVGVPYQYQIGVSYWLLDKVGMYISTSYAQQNFLAEFKNGDQRMMRMKTRGVFNFGLNIGNAKRFYVSAGIGVGNSFFTSSVISKDGTESYGYAYEYNYESNINGVYSNYGFTYDISANVNLFKGLKLVAGISGLVGDEYTDKNMIKGIDRNSEYETVYFPSDYALYVAETSNATSYNYPTSKIAKANLYYLYLGLQYNIKLF